MSNEITVRLAEKTDIVDLCAITRNCFPDQIGWRANFLAKRYWEYVIGLASNEIWLWQVDGKAAGFSHIINDLPAWSEQKKNIPVGKLAKLYAFLFHPTLLWQRAAKRIRINRYEKLPEKEKILHRNGGNDPACAGSYSLEPGDRTIFYGGIHVAPEKSLWVERIAVLPDYRKKGVALKIVRFNEERARALGRSELYGVIHDINERSRKIHELFGWGVIANNAGSHTYSKAVSGENAHREIKEAN